LALYSRRWSRGNTGLNIDLPAVDIDIGQPDAQQLLKIAPRPVYPVRILSPGIEPSGLLLGVEKHLTRL